MPFWWTLIRPMIIKNCLTEPISMSDISASFPMLSKPTHQGKRLVYLDSASSTQKPQQVIDAISGFYSGYYANMGRGIYWPATDATRAYQDARKKVASFINASPDEVIFTSGTTDAINKVAFHYVERLLRPGDEVVVSILEHHSNYLPWMEICQRKGAGLKVVPLDNRGNLDLQALKGLLGRKTRLLAITGVSNVLGTLVPLEEVTAMARQAGALVLVDGAQMVAHHKVDVKHIDCDFLTFSGHKMYGPMGIGVLYARRDLLEESDPFHRGGGMVRDIGAEEVTWQSGPARFEAGTPNIAGAVGLASAIDFMASTGWGKISTQLDRLTNYALENLNALDGVKVLLPTDHQAPVLSFTVNEIHPHDIAGFLADAGIAIRAGHHCAKPLMDYLGAVATNRISLGMYNTTADIDALVNSLIEIKTFFA